MFAEQRFQRKDVTNAVGLSAQAKRNHELFVG